MPILPPAWEALFEAIEDGVCVQSLEARIVRANRAFAVMIGLPLEEILGRPCSEIFGCGNGSGAAPPYCARAMSNVSGAIESEEICGRLPGQRLRSRLSPVRDEAGQVICYVMVVRDITDVIVRERELARVEQLARFGELAAGLAHEIRNPLAGIQGAVDILIQRRSPNDPERSVLESVRREVRRIDATVHTLLERARPRGFSFQTASLTDAVQRAVSLARHHAAGVAAATGHQIKVDFAADAMPILMIIDAVQIEDAVLNLLLNAQQAMPAGGRIRIATARDAARQACVIRVADTGTGIAPEQLARIFEPRASAYAPGPGLYLSKRVIEQHHGSIDVSSTLGIGTTVLISLPWPKEKYDEQSNRADS